MSELKVIKYWGYLPPYILLNLLRNRNKMIYYRRLEASAYLNNKNFGKCHTIYVETSFIIPVNLVIEQSICDADIDAIYRPLKSAPVPPDETTAKGAAILNQG